MCIYFTSLLFKHRISRWITVSADHIVILILLLALVVKFVFFENKKELVDQLKANISKIDKKESSDLRMPFLNTQSFFLDNSTREGKIFVLQLRREQNIYKF